LGEVEEPPEDLIEGLKSIIKIVKESRKHIGEDRWSTIEEDLVVLISDILHAWMEKNNIDPDKATVRIEVEEEEIEVEIPRRITRFRM
jgi:hypothetical protein